MESELDVLNLIGRDTELFNSDIQYREATIKKIVCSSSFLIIGAAGSIGKAVTRELFKRDPSRLHCVDLSENNMVELVREIRSTEGYGSGEFKTFAIDCGSVEFEALVKNEGPYDFVFNLSALKHVRSEKDPYTLMRMITTNIHNTLSTLKFAKDSGAQNYFCVSTDKATNPVNMMGASKCIMEKFVMNRSMTQHVTLARFANVAFSDGSLLHGFDQRFIKQQPISAPKDVRRYFVTPQEAGELCLLSGLFGNNRDIFFPKLNDNLHLTRFSEIAARYVKERGYEVYQCETEHEARKRSKELIAKKKWPCYFFESDTTGEKDFEEFYTEHEDLDMTRFESVGIIKNKPIHDELRLNEFLNGIDKLKRKGEWSKDDILKLYFKLLPNFSHKETGKYLDQRM